ncbi:probable hexosyltransferase MUCI70 [Magnolia sinica]|uniref:probable hexosyltransferase MUCI70 n=1 Tax=Magnolia sinica TaxID=86752 RepID=UPI00265A4DC9|nr:probable hexosyltransferase MUCI70 [Magnolia sinica]
MAFMPTTPSVSPILENLTYITEETPISPPPFGGSPFGGYPSLQQWNESFDIKKSMSVHCGINDVDILEMEECRGIVVASAVFGNYDIIQQPRNINEAAKRNACFYMFVDEEMEAYIKNSSALDSTNRVGLWRVVDDSPCVRSVAALSISVLKLLLKGVF